MLGKAPLKGSEIYPVLDDWCGKGERGAVGLWDATRPRGRERAPRGRAPSSAPQSSRYLSPSSLLSSILSRAPSTFTFQPRFLSSTFPFTVDSRTRRPPL